MEVKKTTELTVFYVGRSGEDGTTKAFCHGKLQDLAGILADAMRGSACNSIVCRAFSEWMSTTRNQRRDESEKIPNKREWISIPRTVTTRLPHTKEKTCICFFAGRDSPNYSTEYFCHGKLIDLANLLAEAMFMRPEFVAVVSQGRHWWGEPRHPRTRNEIFERAYNPEWMSSFQTECTAFYKYPSPEEVEPEEVERKLSWIEKVHKLPSDKDGFFKRGIPGFPWPESVKARERLNQKMAKSRKRVLPQDQSELGKKRMEKLAQKSKEFWKRHRDPDDEPPDLIA